VRNFTNSSSERQGIAAWPRFSTTWKITLPAIAVSLIVSQDAWRSHKENIGDAHQAGDAMLAHLESVSHDIKEPDSNREDD
jgi:hypothetical protein